MFRRRRPGAISAVNRQPGDVPGDLYGTPIGGASYQSENYLSAVPTAWSFGPFLVGSMLFLTP
jgi:hypothetical protein